ncbi:hypothetical protein DH86_00003005, partial [Scytalidium sp. 3C]
LKQVFVAHYLANPQASHTELSHSVRIETMCFGIIGLILSCVESENRPISTIEARSARAQRDTRLKRLPPTKQKDVIYNTAGTGPPVNEERGSKWRWEPFKIGTER